MTEPAQPQADSIAKLAQLPEGRADGKVVRGKEGWLFLDNDSNEFMKQHRGELLFTDEQLAEWRSLLEARIAWLQSRGIPYHFMVAPNPHSVYPDMLPFDVAPGTPRPVTQLIGYLKETESPAQVLYPLDRLVEHRDRPVFTQTNTHWTDLGAFVAYEVLMDEIGNEAPVRRLTSSDLWFNEEIETGDLGAKLDPSESSLHVYAMPSAPVAKMTSDNRVFLNGHRIEYECPAAGTMVCLVLGDSYAHALLPFLCESFGRLVFAHLTTLDQQLVEEVEADIVVSIMNERFIIQVPTDEGAETLEQLAAGKRARGVVYPPSQSDGGNRVDVPAPWRRDETLRVADMDVLSEISPNDRMYLSSEPERYWELGASAVQAIRLSLQAAKQPEPQNILDLPSGHGRVLRALKAAFPNARLTACDTDTDGILFCSRVFGATPIQGREDPFAVELNDTFDLIWVGSLLTHLDAPRWPELLEFFLSALNRDGLLVFTVHGHQVLKNMRDGVAYLPEELQAGVIADYEGTGFGYRDYVGQDGYGISLSAPWWVFPRLECRVHLYSEALWGSHDVFAISRRG